MSKYVFRVYYDDKVERAYDIKLDELNHDELYSIDRFTIENGSYYDLVCFLARRCPIEDHQIKRVTILDVRKDIEFSVITNNEYLRNVLSKVDNIKKDLVSSVHCSEMITYLFEHLQSSDYEDFLNNVYTYKNKFKDLLYQYATIYNQGIYSEEDSITESRLKNEILKRLNTYKNYRGLCICRQKSENKSNVFFSKLKSAKNIAITPTVITSTNFSIKKDFPTIEDETDRYNKDNEEFLEPDEYAMMKGGLDSDENQYSKTY